tara:strand:- start:42 stop:410 length:369 start_codon:yes stop_codon:yes gene_type:complete
MQSIEQVRKRTVSSLGVAWFIVGIVSLLSIFYDSLLKKSSSFIGAAVLMIIYIVFASFCYYFPKQKAFRVLELGAIAAISFSIMYPFISVHPSNGGILYLPLMYITFGLIMVIGISGIKRKK